MPIIIGERERHYQGCVNSRNYILGVYIMYVLMYIKWCRHALKCTNIDDPFN